jgi:hypothetical protein
MAKHLVSPDGEERVVLTRRADGRFTYHREWREDGEWGLPGPDCGIFDSLLTAETEARLKIDWLARDQH